jgi:hypothetical protein
MLKRLLNYIKSEYTWSAYARRMDAEYRKPVRERSAPIERYEWEVDKRAHLRERKRAVTRALVALFLAACAAYSLATCAGR